MTLITPIIPITPAQQQQMIAEVERYIAIGGRHFGRVFEPIPVLFDLKGRTLGMYKIQRRKRVIRFNPWICAKYFDDSLATTVPHEVAHYLADILYGLGNIRPHGSEWKAIMALFGADANVTARFSLEGVPQRVIRRVDYRCGCRDHQLTIHRHNRIRSGKASYLCRSCGGPLRLAL